MSSKRVSASFEATTPEQISALKSRLRGRICDLVYHAGTATVHEVAEQLGKPASTLYPHLDQLIEAGLLLEGEPTRTGKNFGRTYRAPARRLRFTRDLSDPLTREGVADVVASQLRLAEREFRAGLEEPGIRAGRPDSRIASGSMVGWLGDSEVRELNALIARIAEIYDGAVSGPGRSLQAFTYASRPARSTIRG